MRIHQVMVGASPGDAVTRIALAIDDIVGSFVESHLWALHIDPRIATQVGPIEDLQAAGPGDPGDVVLFHVSIGEAELTETVLSRPERLVLYYHNITPSHFFDELDPLFAGLLAAGREALPALVARAELILSASEFSAAEIRAMTDHPVAVTPPPVDTADLVEIVPHGPTMNHFAVTKPDPVILHVGQLLPHKQPEILVGAMHVLGVEMGVPATLILVGPHRNADYAWAIQRYVADLGLSNVWLAGERPTEELAAFYRSAAVFATASAHEGFCVPLVEAFAFDLPVVARACGAVPETVDGAGLLLPPDCGPELMAEALAHVLRDAPLRGALVAAGRERLGTYSVERTRRTLLDALGPVLSR